MMGGKKNQPPQQDVKKVENLMAPSPAVWTCDRQKG